jgi:hypothetical protein
LLSAILRQLRYFIASFRHFHFASRQPPAYDEPIAISRHTNISIFHYAAYVASHAIKRQLSPLADYDIDDDSIFTSASLITLSFTY